MRIPTHHPLRVLLSCVCDVGFETCGNVLLFPKAGCSTRDATQCVCVYPEAGGSLVHLGQLTGNGGQAS